MLGILPYCAQPEPFGLDIRSDTIFHESIDIHGIGSLQ
jgi:hypothetical protein